MKHIRRRFVAGAAVLAVIALVMWLVTGVLGSAVGAAAEAVGLRDRPGDSVDPAIFDPQPPDMPVAEAPPGVAAPVHAEPGTKPDAVRQRIEGVGPAPGQVFGQVVDAADGTELYSADAAGVGLPASTMKVLTAMAALETYGPDHRFVTKTVSSADDPGALWLVGGGDPYLSRADLDGLAQQTAESLKKAGVTRVDLGVDASLFAGDPWNPAWQEGYRDYVAPIEALWVDRARLTDNAVGPREQNPADAAGRMFADVLKRNGIEVGGVTRGTAPGADGVTEHGTVESAELAEIVTTLLVHSDNDATEMIFRHVGRADGGDGSLTAARERQQQILAGLGAWTEGMVISDGSGLSRDNRVSAVALTAAMRQAVSSERPELRSLATGLPVAGAEGTLADRFVTEGTEAGRGVVRGKTGTLMGVSALAGYVRDADGSLLVFAFLVNGEPEADYQAREYLDRASTAVASCGCR